MKEMQRSTLQMLKEIAKICEKHSLKYYLGPETLAIAEIYGGYDRNAINLEILMPISDFIALVKILETEIPLNRSIEYMGNHKHYLGFQVSYINETSTYINMNQGTDFSRYGARINIIPIRRNVHSLRGKIFHVIETGWECNGYRFTRKLNLKRIIAAALARGCMVIGKANCAKLLYRGFCKNYSGTSENVIIKYPKKKSTVLDSEYFSGNDFVFFEGNPYPAPVRREDFLVNYYGTFWRDRFLNRKKDFSNIIFLPGIPYKEFLNQVSKSGMDIKKYFFQYRLSLLKGIKLLRPIKIRSRALLIAARSGDRLRYYEEFQKKREVIHNLHGKGNLTELKTIFAEHEKTTLHYLKRKLGFCVCREFFEIQCELFIEEGKENVVEKLRKLVPEAHYRPII